MKYKLKYRFLQDKMTYPIITIIISKIKFYIRPETKILLGRWAINNSDKIKNIKIDLSNYDNCYGQYKIIKEK